LALRISCVSQTHPHHHISVTGVDLPVVEYMKVLGVVLDQCLMSQKHVSMSDVGGTRGKNSESCSCVVDTDGEVEPRVIGVLVAVNTTVCDDVTHRTAVDGKQQRPEHRPLRNADLELHDW